MNGRGQIDMWRFVRWVPNLSTTDYHSLMSTAVCVSLRFSLPASLQNVLSPLQLCAGPRWPVDHRCAVNRETHTSVIKAVGDLVLYQLPPIPLLSSPSSPYNSILSAELIIVQGQFCPWQFCHFLMMLFREARPVSYQHQDQLGPIFVFMPTSLHLIKKRFI